MKNPIVIAADLTEIVFANRDRDYGAYDIRRSAGKTMRNAFLVVTALFLLGMTAPKLVYLLDPSGEDFLSENKENLVTEEIIPPAFIEEEKVIVPSAAPKAQPPVAPTVDFRVPEPSDLEPDTAILHANSDLDSAQAGKHDHSGDTGGYSWKEIDTASPNQRVITLPEPDKKPKPEDWVDHTRGPAPVNLDEIRDLIGYPRAAKEMGLEGKVTITILVGKEGNYMEHIVVNSTHKLLTNAIETHISGIRFVPALNGKEPVSLWITMPFHFHLSGR